MERTHSKSMPEIADVRRVPRREGSTVRSARNSRPCCASKWTSHSKLINHVDYNSTARLLHATQRAREADMSLCRVQSGGR